ncbi:polyphenol oxidase family protein [Actinomyces sp. B33]|uniref:polyphenol oxidase family protein n=1 Tax=Actinomyces sp. B33 TaxID=2942131 RepID=UPI002340C0FB|nr:polyphenol oxidase family protein [Actinomyces sp. B33]MDC4233086.1 polyphenol oxidase family protein [Actinomyces sp. B33]
MESLTLGGARILLTQAGPGADPYRGNLGLHVGDDPEAVHRRRGAVRETIGAPVAWMEQTHSTRVALLRPVDGGLEATVDGQGVRVGERAGGEWGPIDADGLVVDARDWPSAPAVAVMTADCLPVLLAADRGGLVAAVHAGRRGLVGGILDRAVEILRELGATRIDALIGPSICAGCYEVPDAMRDEAAGVLPGAAARTTWGTASLDLVAAAVGRLTGLGCRVDADPRCTREDPLLHSFRRDPGCGRQASVIAAAPPDLSTPSARLRPPRRSAH